MIHRACSTVALLLTAAELKGQEIPVVEVGRLSERFCLQEGVRSIRVDLPLWASNPGGETAVINPLPDVVRLSIRDTQAGREYKLTLGNRPELSERALDRLEPDGGEVRAVQKDQRVPVAGPYLFFVVPQPGTVDVPTTPPFITLGRTYEIRATFRFWNERQFMKWTALGYLTRREVTVVARLEAPLDPKWDTCPGDPPFVTIPTTPVADALDWYSVWFGAALGGCDGSGRRRRSLCDHFYEAKYQPR